MDKHQTFLSHVPVTGQSIGNIKLNDILKWDRETYNEVKRELVERGELELGRGQGGSVRRVPLSKEENIDSSNAEGEVVPMNPKSNEVVSVLPDYSDEPVEEDVAEFVEEIIEPVKVENSSLDPIVIACPGEPVAASVIVALKEKYTKTQFYTTVDGADTQVRVRLRNFGNLKTILSHEVLAGAHQLATEAMEKALGPVQEEQPGEEQVP